MPGSSETVLPSRACARFVPLAISGCRRRVRTRYKRDRGKIGRARSGIARARARARRPSRPRRPEQRARARRARTPPDRDFRSVVSALSLIINVDVLVDTHSTLDFGYCCTLSRHTLSEGRRRRRRRRRHPPGRSSSSGTRPAVHAPGAPEGGASESPRWSGRAVGSRRTAWRLGGRCERPFAGSPSLDHPPNASPSDTDSQDGGEPCTRSSGAMGMLRVGPVADREKGLRSAARDADCASWRRPENRVRTESRWLSM